MLKIKIAVLFLMTLMGVIFFASKSPADDAGDPYSSKATAGAWYDESWEAAGFYRLNLSGPGYRYEYAANPQSNINDADFVEAGATINKSETTDDNSPPPTEHSHDFSYEDETAGASIPQDIVVTEWKVTGHVHFASGSGGM